MNAEALIGTVLGTCTLQKLVGQGGMGAVFLAQQSRPKRQVAVKVLLPMTPLNPNQLTAFLERFRRETDAAASLEHPNIMPVHEYGERGGLAYLVMPYISGGTLRDELEREGPLPLAKATNYLDQIAAALDVAHEHGVIHRDIKPANILMTPEGRLLLSDFGLVKIVAEGQTPQIRLTGAGSPIGTPDYMAPEQVIGEEVDTRADLYSLGVILYQMVTGTTPFQGDTPMQIAAQHLQIPPPSPRLLRSDLPSAAEQVILRALAKHPFERYMHAQDLATAFRTALVSSGIPLGVSTVSSSISSTTGRFFTPKGLFDPSWQTGTLPKISPIGSNDGDDGLLSKTGAMPSVASKAAVAPSANIARAGGLLSRTGKFPQVGASTGYLPTADASSMIASPPSEDLASTSALMGSMLKTNTHALTLPGQQGAANTVKLTGPVKVVKVPVAGQPGRYVTGLLPVPPQTQEASKHTEEKKASKPWMKVMALVMIVIFLVLGTTGAFWFVRAHPNQSSKQVKVVPTPVGTPNPSAMATATAQANIILSDPLNQNIHNWLVTPPEVFAFKDGAYHITNNQDSGRATVLTTLSFNVPLAYTLTMEEINGNDSSANNSFGMIFRFSQKDKGASKITTFYSFEIVNIKGGEYQFWKYDDTNNANGASPWKELWNAPFTGEFHQGHGPKSTNTVTVLMNGDTFNIIVNGKKLDKTIKDGSYTSGTVGMIVNLKGTEVAFKDLLLTHH